MTETFIDELPNGLRIVTRPMPGLVTASIGVWVDSGSRYETLETNGIAHFLEHMVFKGTATRTAKQIALEIETVGGSMNAWTSREHTAFYARVLSDHTGLALDMIADMLLHSTFDPEEIRRERQVVLQEIGEVEDTPSDVLFDRYQQSIFPDQSVGWPVLGPADNVAGFEGQDLRDYLSKNYGARRLIVAASGGIDPSDIRKQAERLFGDLPTGLERPQVHATYKANSYVEKRECEQSHVIYGYPSLSYLDDDLYSLQLLSTLFGGGMSSRLFQSIREEKGLAYSVFSFAASFADTGTFGIYAGTSPDLLDQLDEAVRSEVGLLLKNNVSADELQTAKNQLKASQLMALESCPAVCEDIARQMLVFGNIKSAEEIAQRIDAVTNTDIARVAERMFADETAYARAIIRPN